MDFFLRLKSGGCFSTGTQSIALVTIEHPRLHIVMPLLIENIL